MRRVAPKVDVGMRVRVAIVDRDVYAVGAADSLDGHVGVVERAKREASAHDDTFLVAFDVPLPRPWSTWQSTPTGFWFSARELEVL